MRRFDPRALVVLALAAAPARAADEVVHDDWYAHFHDETKAGWDHVRLLRSTQDGRTVWISETEMTLTRMTGGALLTAPIRSSSRFVEDEAGNVLSYATSFDIGTGAGPQKRAGKVKDGVIAAVEDGKARSVPYPAGALGPAAVRRAILAALGPGAEGEILEFKAIDASGEKATWTASEKTGLVDVLGRYVWMYRVEKTDSMRIPDVLWFGADGREFAGATNMGSQRWFLTEESIAKTDSEPRSLLMSRIVEPDRAIATKEKPLAATLRLSRKGGLKRALPEEAGQRIVARNADGSIDVAVSAAEPPADLPVLGRPYAGKADMKRFLAETPLVELSNPRLQELATDSIHGLINALRCARAIEFDVQGSLAPSPADIGFGTACDAISSAKGDSTELAVLAVAYARSVGLPARLVAGFVYWEADTWAGDVRPARGAFAFQAWAEVLIADGVWYPIDPNRARDGAAAKTVDDLAGLGGFDATHVAVLKSDLATKTPITDFVLPVLEFMDGLKIEVVEAK